MDTNAHQGSAWFVFWGNDATAALLEDEARAGYDCTECDHTLLAHPTGACDERGCRCRRYRGGSPEVGVDYPLTGNDFLCATLGEVVSWLRSESELLQLDPSLTRKERRGVIRWPTMFERLIPKITVGTEEGYSLEHTIGNITLGVWEQPRQILEGREASP